MGKQETINLSGSQPGDGGLFCINDLEGADVYYSL